MLETPADHPPRNSQKPLGTTTSMFRGIAILGYLWVFLNGQYMPGGARPSSEPMYGFLAAVMGLAVLLVIARAGWWHLRENLDLFVPFGCYSFCLQLLALSHLPAASIDVGQPGAFFAAGFLAILVALITLLLAGIYLCWQTVLVLRSIGMDDPSPGTALERTWPVLWRGLIGGLLGLLGFLLPSLLLLNLATITDITFALFLMAAWGIPWTFLTVTWIPILLTTRTPMLPTLAHASRIAWAMYSRWAGLLWSWLFALGLVVYLDYTTRIHTSTNSNTTHTDAWQLNVKWLAGFENNSSWYSNLISSAKVPTNSAIEIPLALLFLALAIAIKILIFGHLLRAKVIATEDIP